MNSWFIELTHGLHGFTALCLIGLAVFCLVTKHTPLGRSIALFCALSGLWALCAYLIVMVDDLETKIMINRIKMVSPILMPLSLLLIVYTLIHPAKRHLWIFFVGGFIPLISLLMIALETQHLFFIKDYGIWLVGEYKLLTFSNGPWFMFHNANARVLGLISLALIWWKRRDVSSHHHMRISFVFLAIVIPYVGDSIAVHLIPELRFLQITPTLLLLSAVILIYNIFVNRFMDLVPVAREQIINQLDDLYFVLDEKSRVIDFNERAEECLGLRRKDLGLSLSALSLPQAMTDVINVWLALSKGETREIQLSGRTYDLRCVGLDQAELSLRRGLRILVARDVTERKLIETSLQELHRVKAHIIATLSHDIHGNSAATLLMLEELRQVGSDAGIKSSDVMKNIEILAKENATILDLYLQWFRRFVQGPTEPAESFLLSDAVQTLITYATPLAALRGIAIEASIDDDGLVHVSRAAVSAILKIFLSNALLYAPRQSAVTVQVRLRAAVFELIVRDRGGGLPTNVSKDLFNIKQGKAGGLGLYLASELAKAHGFKVDATSTPGVGCEFLLILPK